MLLKTEKEFNYYKHVV